VTANPTLGPQANGLLDCLKEDFPATAAIAGDSFEEIVRAYLAGHPPTEPSIFYAGQYLADFLANDHPHKRWPFLAELARPERTGLRTHAAVHMLDCGWRVNDVLRAIENGNEWTEPARESFAMLMLSIYSILSFEESPHAYVWHSTRPTACQRSPNRHMPDAQRRQGRSRDRSAR
jgi:hypothetical protein